MSDKTHSLPPLKRFLYPFKAPTGQGASDTVEVVDPQTYYTALATAEDGFYPIGANGQWHGGIHFGSETAGTLDQDSGIRCIADGEVIAYRIDSAYPQVAYDSCGPATYSTGFALVRHRLQLPPAPKAAAAATTTASTANTTAAKAEEPSLIFYSLYMHLMHWKGYKDDAKQPRPGYWGGAQTTAKPAEPTPDKVVVLDKPVPVKAGDLMGHLGQYQRYIDTDPLGSTCKDRPLVQLDVFSTEDVAGFIAKSRERAKQLEDKHKTLLFIDTGATLALPAAADLQIAEREGLIVDATSPKSGQWVKVRKGALQVVAKAGLTGYVSATRTYANGSVLSRVVDGDGTAIDVEAFNALSKANQAAYTQREVVLPTGDAVWVERGMLGEGPLMTGRSLQAWSGFPLRTTGSTGPKADFPRVVPVKMLNEVTTEHDGTRWWKVMVGASDGSGNEGWAREKGQAKVRLCTPWDWPGFEIVDADTTTPATFYANHVAKQPQTPQEEKPELVAQGASAESAPLFTKLYDLMDLDNDQALTAAEIQNALAKPWLAQAISRLVTRYDSEWAGPMSKWDAIDPLVPAKRKADWVQEKKRIEKLLWWDLIESKSGFQKDKKPMHLHPIGFLGTFSSTGGCINVDEFIVRYRTAHSKQFGWYQAGKKITIPALSLKSEANLRILLNGIIDKFVPEYGCNIPHIAYMLATARIESYAFWIAEFFGPIAEKISYDQAEIDYGVGPTARRSAYAKKMGQVEIGDGYKYRGRGLVQITWKSHYISFEKHTGARLVSNPDSASEWNTALDIMIKGMVHGHFTGISLSDRITESNKDYVGARNIINGSDKKDEFAAYAQQFEILLRASSTC